MVNRKRFTRRGLIAVLAGFGASLALAGFAQADEIIVLRDVPFRSAIEPAPPGEALAVKTSPLETVLSMVPGPKLLTDAQAASVFGSLPSGQQAGLAEGQLGSALANVDGSGGGASTVAGAGMGSFASLGGSISGQVGAAVGDTVGAATQALSGALGVVTQTPAGGN